jgi:hypothetical protein
LHITEFVSIQKLNNCVSFLVDRCATQYSGENTRFHAESKFLIVGNVLPNKNLTFFYILKSKTKEVFILRSKLVEFSNFQNVKPNNL